MTFAHSIGDNMIIDARQYTNEDLNNTVRQCASQVQIDNCLGQRFIGAGLSGKKITVNGTPGNALGAYLNGADIVVNGNAQDAVGDTMNEGCIFIHGNTGDAAGYAMRGGKNYVEGNAGYRAGIHMKAYKQKLPVMIIGGRCGSFLGEYLAGGIIVVLGMNTDGKKIVGNFPCTGMHGGKVYLRTTDNSIDFPSQVNTHKATKEDMQEIIPYLEEFCKVFGKNPDELLKEGFTVVSPNTANPYKQMYVTN